MKHRHPLGNLQLLVVLTSAIAACGSGDTVGSSGSDSGGDAVADSSVIDAKSDVSMGGEQDAALDGADAVSDAEGAADGADAISDAEGAADAACPPNFTQDDAGCECLPPYQPGSNGTCIPMSVRRPFLVGASLRSAMAISRADWTAADLAAASDLDPRTREALAESWLNDALEEHASIAAFARFTIHLLSVGAPPDLVVAAQRASLDEVRHARACFALAMRYGGSARGPAALDIAGAVKPSSLADIAALTAEEGCVGETLGAILAREQLAGARDPEVVRILRGIVADEVRHAELAWRFVRWAILRGGRPVKEAVARASRRAIAHTRAIEVIPYGVDLEAWHAHGRVSCAEARAIAAAGLREVVEPCLALASGDVDAPLRESRV